MAALVVAANPISRPVYDRAITWWGRSRPGSLALVLGVLALVGCTGDDDAADDTTTTSAPAVSSAPATDPPTTTAPTTTTTTVATPTTPSVEDLKAQIAADYERAAELRDELTRNPTLDGLEEKAALISAPGSPDYTAMVTLIQEMVERGERIVPGEPDLNTTTVELVELSTDSADVATVTACEVFNDRRIGPNGETIGDTGILSALRIRQQVQRTPNGWLPASAYEPLAGAEEVTECPAP
jgi:hypothetical protein